MNVSSFCPSCQMAFALAEKRVRHEGKDYHENCVKAVRREQVKELFIRNAAVQGLSVVPRHHISGRYPMPPYY